MVFMVSHSQPLLGIIELGKTVKRTLRGAPGILCELFNPGFAMLYVGIISVNTPIYIAITLVLPYLR
jgi:hypothetical protein